MVKPLYFCLLASLAIPRAALAQSPPESSEAIDLSVGARVTVGHNGSSAGADGFTRFGAFAPFFQRPGRSLGFFEGYLLLDNGADLGSNVMLGYRSYNPNWNRTLGGYISYDTRDTGNNTFDRLGLGLESLGDTWDVRLNGYIPLGDNRQTTGALTGDNLFGGNRFLVGRIFESALVGFDLEAGARIARFGNSGELRGYVGPYYLNGQGTDGTAGVQARLVAEPTRGLQLGAGVQHDDLFGTNALLSLRFSFPRPPGRGSRILEASIVARLGAAVERNHAIVVERQEDRVVATNPATGDPWFFNHVTLGEGDNSGTFEDPFGSIAQAIGATPTDGNGIIYVRSGASSSTSGFMLPEQIQVLSTGPVQQLDTAEGGQMLLPLSGSGVLPTIDNTVALASNTILSGFRVMPPPDRAGILVQGVRDVAIRDNDVRTVGGAPGIRLTDVSGTMTIANNQIMTAGDAPGGPVLGRSMGSDSIEVNATNTTLDRLTISGNRLRTGGTFSNGILVVAAATAGNSGSIGAVEIADNVVDVGGFDSVGIAVNVENDGGDARIDSVAVRNNTISIEGGATDLLGGVPFSSGIITGLSSATLSGGSGIMENVVVSGNTITVTGVTRLNPMGMPVTGGSAFGISAGIFTSTGSGTLSLNNTLIAENTVNLVNTPITIPGGSSEGIVLLGGNFGGTFSITNTTIDSNTITADTMGSGGIAVRPISGLVGALSDSSGIIFVDNTVISNNTIATQGLVSNGITVQPFSDPMLGSDIAVGTTLISGNRIIAPGPGSDGILVAPIGGNGEVTIGTTTILGNEIVEAGQNTIRLVNTGSNPLCAVISDNTSANPNAASVGGSDLEVQGLNIVQVANLADLNANNNNTFDLITGLPPVDVAACP